MAKKQRVSFLLKEKNKSLLLLNFVEIVLMKDGFSLLTELLVLWILREFLVKLFKLNIARESYSFILQP